MQIRPWWAWMAEVAFIASLGVAAAAVWFYARANNWADGSEKWDVGFTTLVGLGSAAVTRIIDRQFTGSRKGDDDADI